jgi:HAD superfamily hydrolase (TIGR01509 family)
LSGRGQTIIILRIVGKGYSVTISTILFDAGDILYNKPKRKSAVIEFLTSRGYSAPLENDPVEKKKRLEAHAGKIETPAFFEWLMAHYGVDNPQDAADGIRTLKEQQSAVQFFPGVPETLHELKRRGFKLGIVTNTFNSQEEKTRWFKTVGIDDIWDSYADSFVLQITKPDPRIYMAAIDPLNVKPENTIFVGHAQTELDGAKSVGMTTVMFNPDANCTVADFKTKDFSDLLKVPPIAEATLVG